MKTGKDLVFVGTFSLSILDLKDIGVLGIQLISENSLPALL